MVNIISPLLLFQNRNDSAYNTTRPQLITAMSLTPLQTYLESDDVEPLFLQGDARALLCQRRCHRCCTHRPISGGTDSCLRIEQ